jgi:hypothetical protein
MVHAVGVSALAGLWTVCAIGCSDAVKCQQGSACAVPSSPSEKQADVPQSFESDLSNSDAASGAAATAPVDTAAASGTSGNAATSGTSGSAADLLAGANKVQVLGDRLYAWSQDAGLAVVDMSDPAHLVLLGRRRDLLGAPAVVYTRGDVLFVVFSAGRQVEPTTVLQTGTSSLVVLDAADPTSIRTLSRHDVPGAIDGSRKVGDVLYLVSSDMGSCTNCTGQQSQTAISSFDLSDAHAVQPIDQRLSADAEGMGSRPPSVTSTDRRIYVASADVDGQGVVGTKLQVIDISDASGHMSAGAVLKVSGQIWNNWQMDESAGVLRIVTGRTAWNHDAPVRLQTFRVDSSQALAPLGGTTIDVPDAAYLTSAIFEASRAYLVTGSLLMVDLSDPAQPSQTASFDLPEAAYQVTPLGDRLVALGYRGGNAEGRLGLSLLDVSDLRAPKLLSHVNFGAQRAVGPDLFASRGTDRDNPPLSILSEAGLILVPFAGIDYGKDSACFGKMASGVQLIDLHSDTLQLRGEARVTGTPEGALVHRDHLVSVGDDRIEAFTIDDRSAPALAASLVTFETVRHVAQLDGGVLARVIFTGDNIPDLELAASADAGDPNHTLSSLRLVDLIAPDPTDACDLSWNVQSVHAQGTRLYIVYQAFFNATHPGVTVQVGVLVIETADPSAPQLVTNQTVSGDDWRTYYGYQDVAAPYQELFVWRGAMLATIEQKFTGENIDQPRRLHVLDFSDPQAIQEQTLPLAMPDMYVHLVTFGNTLFASRAQQVDATHVKYFVDRFDVTTLSAPRILPPINTPGALLDFDAASGRAITYRAPIDPASSGVASLQLSRLVAGGVVQEDNFELSAGQRVQTLAAGDGVMFAMTAPGAQLLLFGGFETGHFKLGQVSAIAGATYDSVELAASGKKALVAGADAAIVDATNIAMPVVRHVPLNPPGWVFQIDLHADRALLALDSGGVQWVDM